MKRLLNMFVGLAVALGALQAQNVVSVDNEMDVLYVSLENKTAFSAFQMDLKLPDGFEVIDIQLCEERKTEGHNLSYNMQDDGAVRLVSFSNNNETFKGESGALVQVKVALPAAPKAGIYEVALRNVIFTTPKASEYYLSDAKGEVRLYQVTTKSGAHGSVNGGGVCVEGTQVTVSAAPDEGYHFVKWFDGSTANPYTFVVSQSKEITAEFAPNTYYVAYMVDGAITEKEPVLFGAAITLPEAPTMVGHTFGGWQDVPSSMPAHDIIISGSFTVNNYLVTFKIGDEVISSENLAYGSKITAPDAPAKEGHTFNGWGGVAATVPAKDVTYTSSYTVNQYTITFKIGDQVVSSENLVYGSKITAPDAPAKEGHTFNGWGEVAATVPADDVTYEGGYSVNSYQLTYTVDGETIKTESVVYGTAITMLEEPSKEGYTFSGWNNVPATMPAEDVTASGFFIINKYLVTFKIGDKVIASDSLEYGTSIVIPEAPGKEGYTFNGWGEVANTVPACDVTYDGTYFVNSYKLTFIVDGEVVQESLVAYGATITLPEAPEREGYSFDGWSEIPETMPASDVTVSGTFTVNKYLVTFRINDEVIASDSLEYGASIVTPEVPKKEGYTFDGWVNVPETVPACNLTFEGGYTANEYLLAFIIDGALYEMRKVRCDEKITALDMVEREGCTFVWENWIDKMPAKDYTVRGKYIPNKYAITYMVDGEILATDSIAYGTIIEALEEPAKEGYTFSGWSEVPAIMPAEDVTISGSFTPNIYKVYYYVDEELVHTAEVACGDSIPEYVYEPTVKGEAFVGWIGEVYETMPAHDITYKAEIKIADHIEVLSRDTSRLVIYDMTGHKITVNDVRELSKGIYIINGHKVLIK